MLNERVLEDAFQKYTENYDTNIWPDEEFKWVAIKQFQDHWDINADDFEEMFALATQEARNLLDSYRYYPRGMIIDFSSVDPEYVRTMFKSLFDENVDSIERINKFIEQAEEFRQSKNRPDWISHYQTHNSVSTYLWLRYPEKYYIYKYSEFRQVAKVLESEVKPKRGDIQNINKQRELYDHLKKRLKAEPNFLKLYHSLLGSNHYSGESLNTLAFDFAFFISRNYITKNNWFPKSYNPGISKETWAKLLNESTVFNETAIDIMNKLKSEGGQASCTLLSKNHGESYHYYKNGAIALAQRVQKETDCEIHYDKDGKPKWWPILFTGRYAMKDEVGDFIWRVRDGLKEALSEHKIEPPNTPADENVRFWWLTANPKLWSPSSLTVGERHYYTKRNKNGNKRKVPQNFIDAKPGDIVISYESTPEKKIVALMKITEETNNDRLYFEKTENLLNPIKYEDFSILEELSNMEFLKNPNGSLFKLSSDEFDTLMDLIREENSIETTLSEKYSKADLLKDVFIDEPDYNTLVSLILNKKNVILQGPPGVGKTYLAKKLAYSIIGERDESKVEMIQFHQNYTYEDFVRGYKPTETGFEIADGIFYNICKRAENDVTSEYFLIIDEINRANISKVFGELLMLIENNYRSQKIKLAYGGVLFSVPENLHIIGLMNTADRSLALIDYALRRRFAFFNMKPAYNNETFKKYILSLDDELLSKTVDIIRKLNLEIKNDPALGDGFEIGHSYFSNLTEYSDTFLSEVIEYDLIPLLEEYWFDEEEKVIEWSNKLRAVLNV